MVAQKFIAGLAAIVAVGLYGCSSEENEPTKPPVDPSPAVEAGIGFSVDEVSLNGYIKNYISDTIYFESDDWTITSVSFGDEMNRKYPRWYPLTTYLTELSGASAFDENVSWLNMHYADRKLTLTDIEPFFDYEYPKYRYAYLEFRRGEVTDTLVCESESNMPVGGGQHSYPGTVVFPAKGGTTNVMTHDHYWIFLKLRIDNISHTFKEEDGTQDFTDYWTDPDEVFSYTFGWLTIERNKHGDPREITITLDPNTTGAEREFLIVFSGLAPGSRGVCSGRQLAE